MKSKCEICGLTLDPVWVEIGETTHRTCVEVCECQHGEVRGPRYCALCRYADARGNKRKKLQNA
jgi:hypothetical protein